jgi:prolipoprotein diacylglyceryltransferase
MPILTLLGIAALFFWIWMLVDCMRREPSDSLEKLTWVLVILLGTIVGAIIYYVIRKMPRDKAV